MTPNDDLKHQQRWRLILGDSETDEIDRDRQGFDVDGEGDREANVELDDTDRILARAMNALYGEQRDGNLANSIPNIARWLGDIRTYFPTSIARILQQDAIDRLELHHLLLEPEMLSAVEPDVRWIADLLRANQMMPHTTKDTARQVVGEVVAA